MFQILKEAENMFDNVLTTKEMCFYKQLLTTRKSGSVLTFKL